MEVLFGFLFELTAKFASEAFFVAIFGSAAYPGATVSNRFRMWAIAAVCIAVLLWWRGLYSLSSWVIIAGLIAGLVYVDRRKFGRSQPE